jgi:hypothetical protein
MSARRDRPPTKKTPRARPETTRPPDGEKHAIAESRPSVRTSRVVANPPALSESEADFNRFLESSDED